MHFRNLLPYFCGIGSYVKMLCAVIENWFNLRCMYAFLESSTFLPPRPHNTQPSPSDKAIVSQATTWFMISNTPIPSTNTPNNILKLDQFLYKWDTFHQKFSFEICRGPMGRPASWYFVLRDGYYGPPHIYVIISDTTCNPLIPKKNVSYQLLNVLTHASIYIIWYLVL